MPEIDQVEQTRQDLEKFFNETQEVIQRALIEINKFPKVVATNDLPDEGKRVGHLLGIISKHAFINLDKVRRQLRNRFRFWQIRGLKRVGLFGDVLRAKLQLLWDAIADKSLSSILKMINTILESLAIVFELLHAVKEIKDIIEFVIDFLGPEGDPITLSL